MRRNFLGLLVFSSAFLRLSPAPAAPTILSHVPPNLASGISPSAAIVFTFSEAMNTSATEATFQSILAVPPFIVDHSTTAVWTGGGTVLTCTPSPAFPANTQIIWNVSGENLAGDFLEGDTSGFFTTGAGSGSGGSGTNAITTFSVGKVHHYQQLHAGAPTLDPTTPFGFSGVTALASNRTATSVTLTNPNPGSFFGLFQLPPPSAEIFILSTNFTSLGTFDATFPAGNYGFLVQAATSNQSVVVNLPDAVSLPQPNAPHLNNPPVTLKDVDPSQPFVLNWDAFSGGSATNYIYVEIGTNYSSPYPGLPGALAGTALSWTIPAGTLQPNTTYESTIGFYRAASATNASFATTAYRATFTDFTLITTSSGGTTGGPLVLTNASWSAGVFSFDVLCTNGQIVTIEYTTNILSAGPWPKLVTATNTGAPPHITSPQAATNSVLFYRARNGL